MQNHSYDFFRKYQTWKFISAILVTLLFLIRPSDMSAQNNTLYLMHSIPQANQLNPALMHPCRIYISLPVISSVRLNVRNTGFGFHDVFYSGTGTQSDKYFIDLDKLDNKLRRINYSLINADVDLLGVGLPFKDLYLTFGISSHYSFQASYPHDVALLQDKYWNVNSGITEQLNLHNLDANSTAWNSISISASKEVKEGLRVGVRVKYLNGMANVYTRRSITDLNTISDPSAIQVVVNYRINSSLPLALDISPDGLLNNISFEPVLHNLSANYLFTGNHGVAIDAGFTFELDESTQISASFTDLGFIHWKKNLNYFSVSKTFTFSEADLNQFISDPGQNDLGSALGDSLINSVHASVTSYSYYTSTPLNLYGGITRQIFPGVKAGAMTWIEINNGHVRPSLTLSMNLTPFNAFGATLSYTLMNNKFNQLGAGLSFGNRGAQFYLITDNIVTRYVKNVGNIPILSYNARMMSLRFGINLFFGCNKKENNKSSSGSSRHGTPKFKRNDLCPAYR